jgi:hypothetical protein
MRFPGDLVEPAPLQTGMRFRLAQAVRLGSQVFEDDLNIGPDHMQELISALLFGVVKRGPEDTAEDFFGFAIHTSAWFYSLKYSRTFAAI